MIARRLALPVVHSAVLVAGGVLVALAAACASPTAPTGDNATISAVRTATMPTVHNECGVSAGSDQC
jgi:hypothetical protein